MQKYLTGAALALLTAMPGLAAAQDNDKRPTPPPMAGHYRVETVPGRQMAFFMGGPKLGLTLDANADAASKKQGALVSDVMDDSPAEAAGIRKGDIITRFNGTALGGDDPTGTLVELAQKLEPGDTAKLEYRRDGSSHTVSVVAKNLGMARMAMEMPALERMQQEMPRVWAGTPGPGASMNNVMVFGGPGMGLDLVEMNDGLGEYFGTSSGLLVTRAPRDSTMPLRAGDVILTIGGRTPQNEGHAMRILGSYAPGEVVKFEIMRKKGKQSVSWTVPERRGMMFRAQPARWSGTIEKAEKT